MRLHSLAAFVLLSVPCLTVEAGEVEKIKLKTGDRIIFLGDSITAGGVGPKGYVTLIRKQLAPAGNEVQILGAGISGNKVPDLQRRLDKDVLDKKPSVVVIYIGINDVWHGDKTPPRGTDPEPYEQGLNEIVTRCKKAGAQVLLCTPTVIGELPKNGNKLDAKLDEYAVLSRKVAKASGAVLCDLRNAFVERIQTANGKKLSKGFLTSDGVHLNESGNQLVAETMLQHLDLAK